jgi:cbb3-type cytochrome oxidase cytochrome c subunit
MAEAKPPAKYEPPKELEQKAAVQKFQGRAKRQPVDQAEYFYNVKTMHIVMFASSLLLVLGYLLMFRKDHVRNWKEYQDQFARMDFEKLWYDLNEHRKRGEQDATRIRALEAQVDAFLTAFQDKELPITVFDPAAASKSENLKDPKWALVHVEVDKDKKKLGLREIELIRGPREDSQQTYNFRKDEAGALRFQYESAKHHLEEAEKASDSRKDAFERHFRDVTRKYEAKLKEVEEKKKVADALFFQNAFYEDLAGDLQKRPVPGVWDFIERLAKAEVDAFAALAKDARFSEASRKVFERLSKAYAPNDTLKAMANNAANKPEEKSLLAAVGAGQAPATPEDLRTLYRLTMVTDQRFHKKERDVLTPLGRPALTRAEREAVAADQSKASGEAATLLKRLLGMSLEDLRKEIGELRKEIADREVRFEQERPNLANEVRNKPGLDFIKPTIKVQQVVLDNVKDQLNFAQVSKVDRCQTCHVGIDKPMYEVWIDPSKKDDLEKYVFKDVFLREFVAHATDRVDRKTCKVCGVSGTSTDRAGKEMPEPRTAHGGWTSDDAVRFTKTFMAHPRLRDLYVGDNSKHPMLKFGCTICHEGDGRDTHFSRVVHIPDTDKEGEDWKVRHGTPYGLEHYDWNYRELWDAPMIQTKFLQAACRRCHKESVELDGAEKYTAGMKLFERVGCYGCHRTETYQILPKDTKNPHLDPNFKARRPGPPLTRIASKVDETWAKKWVLAPREFRPTTRMPHFFGQSNTRTVVNGNPYPVYNDKTGKRRSPVDDAIATSMVTYLWGLSETTADPEPPASVKGDAGRGALVVAQVGCLACHKTDDTPKAEFEKWTHRSRYLDDFGPSLAAIGSKLKSKGWLYGWLRNPKKHFPESSMPNLRLSEQEAVDVVEYLLTLKNEAFEKDPGPPEIKDDSIEAKAVRDLVFEQLRKRMPDVDALRELEGKGDIAGLDKLGTRLRWLGQKMVKNFGCYSCHELKADGELDWQNEEGIGVELTGAQPWGIKHWDRLDFGNTANDHVTHRGATFQHQFTGEEVTESVNIRRQDWLAAKLKNPRVFDGGKMESKPWDELLRMPNFALTPYEIELLQTFVLSFTDHEVAGLVATSKKLPAPDDKAKNRGDRIARDNNCAACHRFALDTFEVKWTRKENGKERTTWAPVEARTEEPRTPEQAASMARSLLEWKAAAEEELKKNADPLAAEAFKHAWKDVEKWRVLKISGFGYHHRELTPASAAGQSQLAAQDVRGDWWLLDEVDGQKVRIPVTRRIPQQGGDVLPTIQAFKQALEKDYQARKKAAEKRLEDQIKAEPDKAKQKKMQDDFDDLLDAMLKKEGLAAEKLIPDDPGQYEVRYPPMLRTQGVKTQADWLFGFLKNPTPIRPNIFPVKPGAPSMADLNIRMPSFDLSDEEAASLVKWFAVRDQLQGVDVYPHTPMPVLDEARVPAVQKLYKDVVLNKEKGCTSCHWLQGQAPPGDPYKHAPDLGNVAQRLRPRWLNAWVPEPKNIAPGAIMLPAGEVVPGYKEASPEKKADIIQGLVESLLNMKRVAGEPAR